MKKETYEFIGNKLAEIQCNLDNKEKIKHICIEVEDFIGTKTKQR